MMQKGKNEYLNWKVYGLILFVTTLWLIKLSENYFHLSFVTYGVLPNSIQGLPGILFSPFIHSNYGHLLSNTVPLILFGLSIIYFYPKSSIWVFTIVYLLTGISIWLFGREAYHIGASGVIYGFAAFLFFSGVIRRDARSVALALLFVFLYGGMVWGVLPADFKISWEAHLFGGITGIICSIIFRKWDPQKKYDWEDEDDLPEKNEN